MRKFKRILSLLLSIFVIIPLITVAPMAQEVLFTSSAHESDDLTSEKAFDNDLTTRWASDAELVTDENYKWLQVSYPQPQTVNEITIHWQRDNVNSYEILISEDGNDWVSVHESLENTNLLEDIISLETAVVASHFRLVIKDFDSIGLDKDGNEVDYPSVSVYEMELNHVGEEQPAVKVEDPAVVVDQEPTPAVEEPTVNEPTVDPGLEVTATAYVGAQNENLALNKVVTGSDHEVNTQFTKEKIVDGTKGPSKPLATYYASNENDKPIHIIINLGQLTEVESAIIFWERAVADQNITAFTLSGSVDDNAYTPIYTQNTRVDVRNQYINFAATEIQYLKLDITEFDGGALDWVNVGIDEIEVYSHPTSEPVEAYVGAFGENLALGAEVTGTAHEPNTQYTKANMVDGDKNTRYSSDQNVKLSI